ncbi:hypothetical protein HPP92_017222 [Vanilla planifolia]|uniref:Purple acid phosphatase n=1 Tax=Vanilla planifolia TaxID=51239 RepID=A0A835QKF2_VANPL|nr:hypothetical protein HPP92_017222 [Vanilla planifolia]
MPTMALRLLTTVLYLSLISSATAEFQRILHLPKPNASLTLLAIGDWGRNGTFNQSQVAHQMGKIGEELNIDFVVSVGDNFYESGLTDVEDKSFEDSFTKIYTARSLQTQWYSVLGNHDYRGNAMAQLDPILRSIDSRWFCKRSFMVDAEIAHFFFLDTTPFVKKYWKNPKTNHYDWREVAPRKKYISNLLKDMESSLAESTATWKIVIGHHTIRSVSEHGETPELVELLLPMLINYGVDLYINGHDHCLQHISSTDSPLHFLTSGGGSKAWRGIFMPTTENLQFYYDGQGFVSLELTLAEANIKFYDVYGSVLHKWRITKEFYHYNMRR